MRHVSGVRHRKQVLRMQTGVRCVPPKDKLSTAFWPRRKGVMQKMNSHDAVQQYDAVRLQHRKAADALSQTVIEQGSKAVSNICKG